MQATNKHGLRNARGKVAAVRVANAVVRDACCICKSVACVTAPPSCAIGLAILASISSFSFDIFASSSS